MTQPILITGASGTIGSLLVKNLLERKLPLRLALRDVKRSPYPSHPLVENIHFDYQNPESMEKAVQGVSQVFLLTPPIMQATQESFDELQPALSFIAEAKKTRVKHIVRISGMGADQFKSSTHYLIEEAIRDSGMDYTLLRPSFFMQIFNTIHRDGIQKNNEIKIFDAKVKESFVDARDIAAVATEALLDPRHRNQIYTLTSGELLNYEDVAKILTETLDRKITYTAQNEADSYATLIKKGWPADAVEAYLGMLQAVQQGLFSKLSSDVETVLGRKPSLFTDYAKDYTDEWSTSVLSG